MKGCSIEHSKAYTSCKGNVRSTVTTEGEGIVFLPGSPLWCMVVTTAFAQSTVLAKL